MQRKCTDTINLFPRLLHQKGAGGEGGVKSLLHCRCQTVLSIPSHPNASSIYMTIAPACWPGMFHFHRCGVGVIYHFFSVTLSAPLFCSHFTSFAVWFRKKRGLLEWVGGGGVESGSGYGWLRGGGGGTHWVCQFRQNDRQEARQEGRRAPTHEVPLFVWCDLKRPEMTDGGLLSCSDPLLKASPNTRPAADGAHKRRSSAFPHNA